MNTILIRREKKDVIKQLPNISHLDIPIDPGIPAPVFRRDPEWLYGEGIGMSRGPLVMMDYVLKALRHNRMLQQLPMGVLYYLDEGRDCRYSAELIRRAAAEASDRR